MDLFKNGVGRPSNETLRRRKIFGFLVAAVVLLTVGFAALSVTLRINGTGRLEGKYSVHFENYDSNGVIATNTGYATSVAPVINQNKTELNNFSVTFTAPGDAVEFKFRIVNDGNINGEIESITFDDGTITGTNVPQGIGNYITRELKYDGGNALAQGDVIGVNENQVVTLTYYFDREKSLEELNFASDDALTISGLEVTIVYKQSPQTTTTTQAVPVTPEEPSGGEASITPLSYPIEGTLSSGVTYNLTSDGKLTLGGVSTLPVPGAKDGVMFLIISDITDDEFLASNAADLLSDMSYSELEEWFEDENDTDVIEILEDYDLTREEALAKIRTMQNIVPVTTIEFTDDVETITLDSKGDNSFEGFVPQTIIVSSTATVVNAELNDGITVTRRSN